MNEAQFIVILSFWQYRHNDYIDTTAYAGGFYDPSSSGARLGDVHASSRSNDARRFIITRRVEMKLTATRCKSTGPIFVFSNVENGGRSAVNKHDDNFLATLYANYHIPAQT